jgi:cysteinyl-tRNA synthetase
MHNPKRGIYFFNTLTRTKEKFVPIEQGKVGMYTCGPTVYDYAHIGNFRAFLFEDLLRRWLEYKGYEVTQVMNITNVDDRTIKAARKLSLPLSEVTRKYTEGFFEHLKTLNVEKAEHYPKATDHVPEMIALIKVLMDKGYAYRGEDGSIYFNVSKFKDYGKLSKIKVEELRVGARVKFDEYAKEEASDFALWKAWDRDDGDVFWETEIGKGRPGWHIECSAMSMKYLGKTFDIHCGGVDNMFPHHENEIAQSEAATGKKFVNYWMHNEHLLVEGRKMSKRLGNYYTVQDLISKECDPRAIRYVLVATHYRQQVNFTFDGLAAANSAVERLLNFLDRLDDAQGTEAGPELEYLKKMAEEKFENAMGDDLNISTALAAIFDFVREVNNLIDKDIVTVEEAKTVIALMMRFDKVLGLMGNTHVVHKLSEEAQNLIQMREEARRMKDWNRADEIRRQLKEMGIIVEDTPKGLRWRIEKH